MKQTIALLLAAVLGLAACDIPVPTPGGTSGENNRAVLANCTLSQPVYPKFPARPVMPEEMDDETWNAYYNAQSEYEQAVEQLRGEGVSETTVNALNAFAGKSIPRMLAGQEGKNAICSPLSLWSAMALLAQCCAGNSRAQVLDALGTADVATLQNEVSQVWKGLYTDEENRSLLLANSIWLNDRMAGSYVQETLDVLAQKYFAGTYSVPMGSDQADQAVTQWAKEQTNGLIGGEQPIVQTQADTLALLASALYYRAGWTDNFSKDLTQKDVFTTAAGAEREIDFMHQTQRSSFLRRDGYQAAYLPTELGEMVFLLPDEGVTPESLLADPALLSGLDFQGQDAHWGKVQWSVPKFDVNSKLNLIDALRSMGVQDVLDKSKADMSALTTLDAYVSGAEQLARVKVDEEGVEAAAVTIFMVFPTSAMPDPDPEVCVMDLDRPFLFVLRIEDLPLFVGIVNEI